MSAPTEIKHKIRVFVGHRPIGWLRELTVRVTASGDAKETVVTPSLSKATSYPCLEGGYAMALFQGPDREPGPKAQPPVTFQLCRV